MKRYSSITAVSAAFVVLACGGGDVPAPDPSATTPILPEAPADPEPEPRAVEPAVAEPSDASALPVLHLVSRDKPPASCEADAQHDALCASLTNPEQDPDPAALETLWRAGANLDCTCEITTTRKKLAASIPIVQDFVKKSTRSWTSRDLPLQIAMERSDSGRTVRWLLEHGANPNASNDQAETPLDRALYRGGRDAVLLLLAAGSDAKQANLGRCPDVALIDLMLAHGARGETIDLAVTLNSGDLPALQRFLASGADPSKLDGDAVARRGDLAMTRALLDAGLSPDQPGFQGQSMLAQLAERGDLAHVELLLERGANPNHRSEMFGVTPLYNALSGGADLAVVERLLQAKANPNARNPYGDGTLLQWLIDERKAEAIPLLVRHGAVLGTKSGETPVQYARRTDAGQAVIDALTPRAEGQ